MGKSIDVMECFIGALLDNKQSNVSLIDLLNHFMRALLKFYYQVLYWTQHCVCVCVT